MTYASAVAADPAGAAARIDELDSALDELRDKLDAADTAASETAPDWRTRCYRILGALGLDFGDPEFMMPDERKKLDEARDLLAIARVVVLKADQAAAVLREAHPARADSLSAAIGEFKSLDEKITERH